MGIWFSITNLPVGADLFELGIQREKRFVGVAQTGDWIRSRKVIVDTRPSARCEHVHVAGFDEIHLLVGDETLDNLGRVDTDTLPKPVARCESSQAQHTKDIDVGDRLDVNSSVSCLVWGRFDLGVRRRRGATKERLSTRDSRTRLQHSLCRHKSSHRHPIRRATQRGATCTNEERNRTGFAGVFAADANVD